MAKTTTITKGSPKKTILGIVFALLLVGSLAFGGLYFKKHRDLGEQNRQLNDKIASLNQEIEIYKTNPQQAAQAEVERYVGEIGKLYALPPDEKPSVATVSDKEKLKGQQFFAKAENGDITLIYANAKLALLYRPSTGQIVNVSSVTIQDQQTTPAQ